MFFLSKVTMLDQNNHYESKDTTKATLSFPETLSMETRTKGSNIVQQNVIINYRKVHMTLSMYVFHVSTKMAC